MKGKKTKVVNKQYKEAAIWKRIVAYIIDILIYVPFAFIFLVFSKLYAIGQNPQKAIFMIICLLIVSVILFSYTPKKLVGQTLGKKAMGIKIQPLDESIEISYWTYFLREYVAKVSFGFLAIPMTIMYFIFLSVGNRKFTKIFMLDQLFSVRVIDIR